MAQAKKKIVAILSKDDDIKALKSEMENLFEETKVPVEFLAKRLDALKKDYDGKIDLLWRKLGRVLCEKGYIPADEFNYERDAIGFSEEEDAVYWRKFAKVESSSGMPEGLKSLLEALISKD